ncbi:PhzF family phenazine biosynthesis protein [Plantibacter sp. YIM 135347]|uniref:PhzF family phenazine biosynthesis protein n=1 Tax=Plantibacter sp. YIM 135347 TaxID=3423919 RepID=UPI003D330CC9
MHGTTDVERYASFADHSDSGNPAGVVLDAQHLTAPEMQRIAADVGYSETVFVTSPLTADAAITVRYFAPEGEVAFCGHATIALAAALGRELGFGDFVIETAVGPVTVSAERRDGHVVGSFLSPPISSSPIDGACLDVLLGLLGWSRSDLHPDYAPAIGFSGNQHPILVARDLTRLAELAYDFDGLRRLSRTEDWVTMQLITPTGRGEWRSRNPFPWGGVVEDPATGSAAAAFAGYLLAGGHAESGERFTITQGVEMGRPSRIEVELLDDAARIAGPVTPIERGAETDHESGASSAAG